MKVTQEGLSKSQRIQMYDVIYKEADALIKKANPCKFKDGKCAEARRTGKPVYFGAPHCCGACRYHGKNGCRVKSLGCKLWTCSRFRLDYPELCIKLDELQKLAYTLDIYLYIRQSKRYAITRIKHSTYRFTGYH